MNRRRSWIGVGAGVLGLTLALAPLTATAASAANHKVKGSNPNSAMCKTVKNEQTDTSGVSSAIEKAMTSGNFAQAKAAMLKAYDTDAGNVQKALAVVKTAPPKVQKSFKDLLSFVKQVRTDIQNASSLQGLVTSFSTLGSNQKLETDGATIANWYAGVCGGTLVTPTTVTPSSVASP